MALITDMANLLVGLRDLVLRARISSVGGEDAAGEHRRDCSVEPTDDTAIPEIP